MENKSRKDRRVLEDVNKVLQDLVVKYQEKNALHGEDYDMEAMFKACDIRWRGYARTFNARGNGWKLDPNTFTDKIMGFSKVAAELAPIEAKINKDKQFQRWLNIEKSRNKWLWLLNILDKICIFIGCRSLWEKRYEKLQK